MHFPLALCILLAAGSGGGQVPSTPPSAKGEAPEQVQAKAAWEAFLEGRQAEDPRELPWVLMVRQADLKGAWWRRDEVLHRLVVARDLRPEYLDEDLAAALWTLRGWGAESHWVLLDPSSKVVQEGKGTPNGKAVTEALQAAGYRSRPDRREAFLKEHPEQGEAWSEQFLEGLTLAQGRRRSQAPQDGESSDEDLAPEGDTAAAFEPGLTALEGLLKVPGWWRGPWMVRASQMRHLAGAPPQRLRAVLGQAREELLKAWAQEPHSLEEKAPHLLTVLSEALGERPPLPALQAAPGRVWPSAETLRRLLNPYVQAQDWKGLWAVLEPASIELPAGLEGEAWLEARRARAAFSTFRALAQAGLLSQNSGARKEALSALADARTWAGAEWGRSSECEPLREALARPGGDAALRRLLERAPEADPPEPKRPFCRFLLVGDPAWKALWSRLPSAPVLQEWGPRELQWGHASEDETVQLRSRYGWDAKPRWALVRSGAVLATGTEAPGAPSLAAHLMGAAGPSRLRRLDTFIAKNPGHRDARRERFALLRSSMPTRNYEGTLAEDAREALIALDFGPDAPWKPHPRVWQTAALRVLPQVEEGLRHWPSSPELWRIYLSWSAFDPSRPNLADFVRRLPLWGREGRHRDLPRDLHRMVEEVLEAQGRYEEMEAWFRVAFEALDRRPLLDERGQVREWLAQARNAEGAAIVRPLRAALDHLGRRQEGRELELEWAQLSGESLPR